MCSLSSAPISIKKNKLQSEMLCRALFRAPEILDKRTFSMAALRSNWWIFPGKEIIMPQGACPAKLRPRKYSLFSTYNPFLLYAW
jgi:hypothetical protein